MENKNKSIIYFLLAGIKKVLFDGVTVIVPLTVTVLILIWVFHLVDNVLQPIIVAVYGQPITGLGFIVLLELMLLAGIMVNSTIGSRFLEAMDALYAKIPIFSTIYFAIKPVTEVIVGSGINKGAFRKVVFVEWPVKGMKTIAFVTKEQTDPKGRRLYSVYIPTSPTPQTGFYMIAHEEQVSQTDISIDEAMKMVISAGIISPGIVDVDRIFGGVVEESKIIISPKKRRPRKPREPGNGKVKG
jgi:uncharacterized membrane protein